MNFKRYIILVVMGLLSTVTMLAQSQGGSGGDDGGGDNDNSGIHEDPGRAAIIIHCTSQEKSENNSLAEALPLQALSHTYTGKQMEDTRKAIEDFRSYLDSVRHYIAIAADLYFMYLEVGETIKNIKELQDICSEHPDNAVAVSLSERRSHLYKEVASEGVLIISDIRKALFSKTKMTEYERYNILSSIRPKLQRINSRIRALIKYVRYTNFSIIWDEMVGRMRRFELANTGDCARAAMDRWIYTYQHVR